MSKDFLDALNYDSSGLRKYLGEYSFKEDDDQVNSTEQFLLDWIDEVWVKNNGNQELYAKFLQDLRGNLQEFELYEKELAQAANSNILSFEALVSELQQVNPDFDDKFLILAWLFYEPEFLLRDCENYYFLADDGNVDASERSLLYWIKTEWVDKEGNSDLADEIAAHLAQKEMEIAAKRFRNSYSRLG
ncbi:MAG: hypothetical protein F6K14_25045 [Symploca sp. SIO2C1]|nr:hypothetical protein [Symploca sp. SIO2C1]